MALHVRYVSCHILSYHRLSLWLRVSLCRTYLPDVVPYFWCFRCMIRLTPSDEEGCIYTDKICLNRGWYHSKFQADADPRDDTSFDNCYNISFAFLELGDEDFHYFDIPRTSVRRPIFPLTTFSPISPTTSFPTTTPTSSFLPLLLW